MKCQPLIDECEHPEICRQNGECHYTKSSPSLMRTGPYPHCANCPHPHDALECCIHRRGPVEIEPGWLPEGNSTIPPHDVGLYSDVPDEQPSAVKCVAYQDGCPSRGRCSAQGDCMDRPGATFVPPSGAPATSVLREAADIVEGVRNTTHGDKERSFVVIAELWSVYLEGRKTGGPVTSFDVAQMMVLLKIARSIQGTAARDHFVDQAGYSSIAAELANV